MMAPDKIRMLQARVVQLESELTNLRVTVECMTVRPKNPGTQYAVHVQFPSNFYFFFLDRPKRFQIYVKWVLSN